jgi:prephenate dehydrogenase
VEKINIITHSTQENYVESYLEESDMVIFSVPIKNTISVIKNMSNKIA